MNTFRATSPTGEITEYEAALPDPEHLTPGWRCEQIIIAQQNPDEPSPPSPQIVYDALVFLRRFTPQERIIARTAAKSDPIMEDFYALLDKAAQVHNDDPDMLLGMGYMVQQGYLTTERVQEILYGQ